MIGPRGLIVSESRIIHGVDSIRGLRIKEKVKRMSLYKRGDVYWYDFRFNGARVQESA